MRICYYLSTCFIIRFEGDANDFSCARSNVSHGKPVLLQSTPLPPCPSHSPSLTLGMLHLWMVIPAIQLPRTISHSSCSRSSFSAGCLGKCVQRFLKCLTFVVCEASGRGRGKEVRVSKLRKCDVHRISHLTVSV